MAACTCCNEGLTEWTGGGEPRVFLCTKCLFRITRVLRDSCADSNDPNVSDAVKALDFGIAYGADWHAMDKAMGVKRTSWEDIRALNLSPPDGITVEEYLANIRGEK